LIYIAYAVSGPLKRVFIEALKYGFSSTYGFKDSELQKRINIKGVVRQIGKPEKYDDFELKLYNSSEELLQEYEERYSYVNEGEHFAVSRIQIEKSIMQKNDHFIICNDPSVISNIVSDFEPNVKLLHFSLRNYYIALKTLCATYDDDYDDRLQKIIEFERKLEESGIQYDVDLKIENNEQNRPLEQMIWEALDPRINNKYFCWRNLLSTDSEGDAFEQNDSMRFEKDYGNVIYSSAFRRLQDKAQVFPLERYDYVRTRLTHSIECATIAEQLGLKSIAIIKKHPESGFIELCNKIPMLLKTASLLHDMGNPPFGHFGEGIIRDWFRDNLDRTFGNVPSLKILLGQNSDQLNDLMNFEGNAQLLRLVSKLSMTNGRCEDGLNLTYATLATIIKYPVSSSGINASVLSKKKLGYYTTERELFSSIQSRVRLNEHRHPLTFLLEAADDISYLASDLQDAHHKGLIRMPIIKQELMNLQNELDKDAKIKLQQILDSFEQCSIVSEYHLSEDILLSFVCDSLRNTLIDESVIAFDQNYTRIMEGDFEKELLQCMSFSLNIVNCLRRLLRQYVYDEPNIIKSEISASKILGTLLDAFIPAALLFDSGEEPSSLHSRIHLLLSENYKHICSVHNHEINKNPQLTQNEKNIRIAFNKVLLATDFVCGMTDSYAKNMYNIICAQS